MNSLKTAALWIFGIAGVCAILFLVPQKIQSGVFLAGFIFYCFWFVTKGFVDVYELIKSHKPKYKYKIIKSIYEPGKSPEKFDVPICDLEAEIELPFIPQIDMAFTVTKKDDEFNCGPIKKIYWNYNRFICNVEPFIMNENHDIHEVVRVHEERGWEPDFYFNFDLKNQYEERKRSIEKKAAEAPYQELEKKSVNIPPPQ